MPGWNRWFISLFLCWWIFLIPLEYDVIGPALWLLQWPFREFLVFFDSNLKFASDGSGMYALLALSAVLALFSAVFIQLTRFAKHDPGPVVSKILTFFLVLILFKYGWIKIIKLQFYLPEPNILYTEFGKLSKDIAYWSLMGSSRFYSVFMGCMEVMAGVLLLFSRTRFVGLLLAAGIFINVLVINISFDISVKLFSASLLIIIVYLISGYKNQLRFLMHLPLKYDDPEQVRGKDKPASGRLLVILMIIVESVFPAVEMGSLNDDSLPRPEHHGAYEIQGSSGWKRLFIHRNGYLVLEDSSGNQLDFRMKETQPNTYLLTDERTQQQFSAYWRGNYFILKTQEADSFGLKRLPYSELPLLKEDVHVISDKFH